MIRSLLAATAGLLIAGHAFADTPCISEMPDGSGKIVIHDRVPGMLPSCYAFTAAAGQKASIDITTDDTMGFGLEAIAADGSKHLLGDNHHSTSFTTEATMYHVLAGPSALHADTTHEFTLTIQLK